MWAFEIIFASLGIEGWIDNWFISFTSYLQKYPLKNYRNRRWRCPKAPQPHTGEIPMNKNVKLYTQCTIYSNKIKLNKCDCLLTEGHLYKNRKSHQRATSYRPKWQSMRQSKNKIKEKNLASSFCSCYWFGITIIDEKSSALHSNGH